MEEFLKLIGQGEILLKTDSENKTIKYLYEQFDYLKTFKDDDWIFIKRHFKDYISKTASMKHTAQSFFQYGLEKVEKKLLCASPNSERGKAFFLFVYGKRPKNEEDERSEDAKEKEWGEIRNAFMKDLCALFTLIDEEEKAVKKTIKDYILEVITKLEELTKNLDPNKEVPILIKKKYWEPLYDLLFKSFELTIQSVKKKITIFAYMLHMMSIKKSPTAEENKEYIKNMDYSVKAALNVFNTEQFGMYQKPNFIDEAIETFKFLDDKIPVQKIPAKGGNKKKKNRKTKKKSQNKRRRNKLKKTKKR